MTTYDVRDEAVLEATPEQIVRALLDETQGRSSWWQPRVRMKQVGELPITAVGGLIEFAVTSEAHADSERQTLRFTARVIGTDSGRQLTLRVCDGDFRGVEEWAFTPIDDLHTRAALHWWVRPHGRLRLVAPFYDIPAVHSQVMQEGFRALEAYVRNTLAIAQPQLDQGVATTR